MSERFFELLQVALASAEETDDVCFEALDFRVCGEPRLDVGGVQTFGEFVPLLVFDERMSRLGGGRSQSLGLVADVERIAEVECWMALDPGSGRRVGDFKDRTVSASLRSVGLSEDAAGRFGVEARERYVRVLLGPVGSKRAGVAAQGGTTFVAARIDGYSFQAVKGGNNSFGSVRIPFD